MKTRLPLLALIVLLSCIACKSEGRKEEKHVAEQPVPIAVIGTRDVLTQCEAGARIVRDIQAKFSDRRIRLGLLEQDIRALREETRGQPPQGPKHGLLLTRLQEFAEEERRLRQDVAQEESEQFRPVLEQLSRVVEDYSRESGIAAIQERGTFVYYRRSLDITQEIIERVNRAGVNRQGQ